MTSLGTAPVPTDDAARPLRPYRGRIVVADDVAEIAQFMVDVLSREGFDVRSAFDGDATLDLIRDFRPELLILDIMMPRQHGIDVLRRLAEAGDSSTPLGVIVCSARTFKHDVEQVRELGAFDVLPKPFVRQQLMEKVEAFFDHRTTTDAASPAKTPGQAYLPKLDTSRGTWRLWGTRGSIPVSGPRFTRHGGNTSCLELHHGDDLVIIDAGSGIRDLGLELAEQPPRRIALFIGHTHWDHIQGFPFFAPAYTPGFHIDVYGAAGFGKDLESVFRGQLDRDYFPVEMHDLAATLEFHQLHENPIEIGDLKIGWEFVNHPGATIGFRIEADGRRTAYITDNEFLQGYLGSPADVTIGSAAMLPFRNIVEFCSGMDLLIHEAQYTNEEYTRKIGWGHSSLTNACALAAMAEVRRWIVTHHDPMHDDAALERKLNLTRQVMATLGRPVEVEHAFDGMSGRL
jgi:phosphoribosyl 1,2-cyclic phosphodiesterase/CheY-like chemotaxis protein